MPRKHATLREGERLDDLLTHELAIIQSESVFSFSLDAVLLARFCTVPTRGRIVDLCTGNGVIPLLLSTRTKAPIVGVEIQPRLADMAKRSVELNGLQQQIDIREADLRTVHEALGYGLFDLVTVNPPYLPVSSGEAKSNPHIAAARHELHGTLDEVLHGCARLVRTGGKVAIVHRPSRLVELMVGMRKYKLEPKRMRLVHPRAGEPANMVVLEAIRDGRPELKVLPPLVVYEGSRYCDELLNVYYAKADKLSDGEANEAEHSEKQ